MSRSLKFKAVTTACVVILGTAIVATGAMAQGYGGGGGGGRGGPLGMMTRADTNGDGKISFAEYEASRLDQFKQLDTNNDGKISADELDAWAKARIADMTARMGDASRATTMVQSRVDAMKAMDTDKDGAISLDEYKADYTANFKRIDTNSDGFISADEYQAEMKAMQAAGH